MPPPPVTAPGRLPPALWVWLAGVVAALHIAKLPPAIPVLQRELGITWLQAGFLLSTVQVAGMVGGVLVGVWVPRLGLRRSLIAGLCLLGVAGLLGAIWPDARALLALRAVEGCGVLLTVLSAPALLRRLVPAARLPMWLGVWGAYMPVGAALAMWAGPWWLQGWGWSGWWEALAVLAFALAAICYQALDGKGLAPGLSLNTEATRAVTGATVVWSDLRQTLQTPGVWGVALCFALYSSQWLAVVGFLPTVYALAKVDASQAAWMTAWVTLCNGLGNIAAGRLLMRGHRPVVLLSVAFVTMGLASVLAYADLTAQAPWVRFAAVWLFSTVGGLLPGTLFSLAVRVAPGERLVSTTVGWVQQCSSTGQFLGPPVVAWLAAVAGGWHFTWVATFGASAAGLVLVQWLNRSMQKR